jgi:ribosomal protein S18 acetylase RimI-like enzyme
MSLNFNIRAAQNRDSHAIGMLINYRDRVHRHLDWRSPLDLLADQPYFVLESDFSILAALACPEDPPEVAWIRFFGALPGIPMKTAWQNLFKAALNTFEVKPKMIVSVAVESWYLQLLLEMGFSLYQTIVVLFTNIPNLTGSDQKSALTITPMLENELERVMQVDNTAFESIWRYSLSDLRSAFRNSAYATVARFENRIVGYQISSATVFSAHLARLAVLPDLQGKKVGTSLVNDMIHHFNMHGIETITVNTQSNNAASLRLYRRLGFIETGEKFPVLNYLG